MQQHMIIARVICLPFLAQQVQFQAVALMHALRANDRLAVSKLVTQLTRSNVRSPMAQCLLVRYVAQVWQVAE